MWSSPSCALPKAFAVGRSRGQNTGRDEMGGLEPGVGGYGSEIEEN